jgi:hypothetical protein
VTEDRDDTRLVTRHGAAPVLGPDDADTVIRDGRERHDAPRTVSTHAAPVPEAAPRLASYSYRISSASEAIPLDVPSYIGRRPTAPRITGGEVSRLVRVPSPLREVSATHLEVRQLGSSVIVTDLRTTNGTVVTLPGGAPRKLLQGESVVVSPGTLVDIGDENILQVLPMHSPTRSPGDSRQERQS